MRNPIYKFYLGLGNEMYECHPIYKELTIEATKSRNQIFLRKKVSGTLTFLKKDYDKINSQSLSMTYKVYIHRSLNGGLSYSPYAQGRFFKTDAKWDVCNKTISVELDSLDEYNDILAIMDKEVDLLKKPLKIAQIDYERYPTAQVYVLGSGVMGYYQDGIYWEEDCDEVDDEDTLTNTYHFSSCGGIYIAFKWDYFGDGGMTRESAYDGEYVGRVYDDGNDYYLETTAQGVTAKYNNGRIELSCQGQKSYIYDDIGSYGYSWWQQGTPSQYCSYQPLVDKFKPYGRLVFSKPDVNGAYTIPYEDIVSRNVNYKYCLPYGGNIGNALEVSVKRTEEPTKYGIASDGRYFEPPYEDEVCYPIATSTWLNHSLWIRAALLSTSGLALYTHRRTLNNAYPIASIISNLLDGTGLAHEEGVEYSQFLYGDDNKISSKQFKLFITPKTNITNGDYDTPAQTCKTTLGTILNALRNMFNLYWYVEEGKLKIEHEEFFRNGYSYDDEMGMGLDLTTTLNKRGGRPWAEGQGEYSFDKADMPSMYKYGWMDEVSDAFEVDELTIESKFVSEGQTEDISVNSITTDINYAMVSPSNISNDGMFMLATNTTKNSYGYLQVVKRVKDGFIYQNGVLSWDYLIRNFHTISYPVTTIKINGEAITTKKASQNKKSSIKFPMMDGFDEKKMIKTLIGYAIIEKYSVSLQSLQVKATLAYDNE